MVMASICLPFKVRWISHLIQTSFRIRYPPGKWNPCQKGIREISYCPQTDSYTRSTWESSTNFSRRSRTHLTILGKLALDSCIFPTVISFHQDFRVASGWAVAGNAKGSKNILGVPGVFCEDSGVAQGWPLGKVGLGPLSHVRVFPCISWNLCTLTVCRINWCTHRRYGCCRGTCFEEL